MSDKRTNRRRFMKATGIGSLGIATGLAGCTGGGGGGGDGGGGDGGGGGGGGGGDGGDGGGGGGDGGGGGGQDTPMSDGGDGGGGQQTQTPTTTAAQELEQVNISLAPSGFQGIIMDYMFKDTNLLINEMNDRGYKPNVQKTWEGAALFAAGGPDFSTISTFEAARLSARRGLKLVAAGKLAPLFMGWWSKKGTKYDPKQAGSAQKAMDRLVNNNATVGIGSWAGGDVPGYQMAIKERFGYNFTQGPKNDFKTVTASYGAIPKLIVEGKLKAGGTSPVHGVARQLNENGKPKLRQIYNVAATIKNVVGGVPPLNNITTNRKFWNENPGAVTAYVSAWQQGIDWFFEAPIERVKQDKKEHLKQLFVNNMTQARYLINWGIKLSLDNEYPYIYGDVTWSNEDISADKQFLNLAQKRGFIPKGYKQRLSYVQPLQ